MGLRRLPSAVFSTSKKSIAPNNSTPGPNQYSPNRIKWKRRASAVLFNREKRKGFGDDNRTLPGPGSYMIPCRFNDKPKFMTKDPSNGFRFV